MMRKSLYMFLASMMLIAPASCESVVEDKYAKVKENDQMEILDICFNESYEEFYVDLSTHEHFTPVTVFDINQVTCRATELHHDLTVLSESVQPTYLRYENIKSQIIAENGLKALVLVDLTLSEDQILLQKMAVNDLRLLFNHDNLFVAFMYDGKVTESYPVTDYLMAEYFVHKPSQKRLYRSILDKIYEVDGKGPMWKTMDDSEKILIVLSDGKIYGENEPIDHEHYEFQELLVPAEGSVCSFPIYYINVGSEDYVEEGEFYENEAENIVSLMCDSTGGKYFDEFSWSGLSAAVFNGRTDTYPDWRVYFSNPDKKVYKGNDRWIRIEILVGDRIAATGHYLYSRGSIYNPIIVNGMPLWKILVQGLLIFAAIFLTVYLIFQLLIPFVRYKIFMHRHVTGYVGSNMSFNNLQIEESCYLCKAPFQKGDQIVAKCEHTVHKSCWDENEYKCPEFGRNCKDGSHYYNRSNLFDRRNPSFYMNWLLAGICAAAFSWFTYLLTTENMSANMISQSLLGLFIPDAAASAETMAEYGYKLLMIPCYGFFICFFLTFFLAYLSSHGHGLWKRMGFAFLKGVVAGIFGYLTFVLTTIAAIAFGLPETSKVLDWIPWTLNGFMVVVMIASGTDIKLKKALTGASLAILLGLGSMFIWDYSSNSLLDTRDLLMVSNYIYCVGLAITLAANSPKSERYFLRVEGPVKTMDIALYKWMKTQFYNRRVTIGKSVDCNIQMSWDVNGNIAPKQAEVVSEKGNVYLVAVEKGVSINGKSLNPGQKLRLYHGNRFMIGQTTFTFVEKDIS